MNYVVTSGTTVDFSRYCSTAVHSYLVCIQCVLVVGDVGGLGPQVIHGPYPGAAEETGHPNQTAEHWGLDRDLSVPITHCWPHIVWKEIYVRYNWFLQSSFLMVSFCSLPIIACMYSSLTLMLWFSGSAALGQILPRWLTLLQYWNRITKCSVKILKLRYSSLQMLQLK